MIKQILVAMLLVLVMVPAAIAEDVVVQTISEQISPTCVTYDSTTQKDIVSCQPIRPRIDVVFVIDSTGSMNDEIRTVQTHLTKIIKEVKSGQPTPDLRVGVVSYRDHQPEDNDYIWKKNDLTYDIDDALEFIWSIEASGGGDLPEAVADGLEVAINDMDWGYDYIDQNQYTSRQYSKKLIFLIGDAAPHGVGAEGDRHPQWCPFGYNYKDLIEQANQKDITIYTVSGSGIDDVGVRVFKQIAEKTGGMYTQLNYVRQDVEQYYRDEGFVEEEVMEYATAAKADADYDRSTNSILTNTLGAFASKSMQAEAQDIGVKYNDNDWIDPSDITGDVVVDVYKEEKTENLSSFLKKVFDRIAFWR